MYTTCIIWLAFVPLYFGTGTSYEVFSTDPADRFEFVFVLDQYIDWIFDVLRSRSQRCVWRSPSQPMSLSSAFTPQNSTSSSFIQKRMSGDCSPHDCHHRHDRHHDHHHETCRKLTMNTVKRPTVLAAAMPLMAATTVDATLCKGCDIYSISMIS